MESKNMSKAKAVSTNKVKKSREDWIFDIILYTIGVLLIIITLYPMYFIIIASFSDPAAVSNGQIMFLPKGVNFKGYKQLASYAKLWTGYRNTIAYVIMGTLVTLVVNIPASYALSRKHLYGKRFFTAFYLIPMFFTGGLIPTYLAVQRFHLLDTFWVMVVIALWAAVGQWNSYFNALIYIRSESLQPLQIVLRSILVGNQTMSAMSTGAAAVEAKQMADLIKYAIIVVSSAPIMCMYPLVQKYFNQGVMLGSLKG